MSDLDREGTRPAAGATLPRLLLSSAIPVAAAVALAFLAGARLPGVPLPWVADEAMGSDAASMPEPGAGSAGPMNAPTPQPVAVVTAPARRGDLVMAITAAGVAEAERQLQVATAQAGTITELPVRNSDVVEAGVLLASIDDTELRLNLQKARESLVLAIARFTEKRAFVNASAVTQQGLDDPAPAQQELLAGTLSAEDFRVLADAPRFDALFRTITRQEVAAAQDRLMTERANFAQAELDLAHAGTYAPFAGQVSDLQVIVGQRVGAGASLLTLIDADPVRVRVDVLESEAGRVRGGRRAEVRFAAYPGAVFAGEVEAISPVVDPETRTMAVTVSLPNPGLRLKPGMFASIALETEIFADRLLVPADAVLLRDERPMLFVVRDGRARWAYIEKGQENADWVEVLSGVDAGDEVVISGHYSLAHDAAVRVVDSEAHGDLDDSADAGAGDGAR